MITQKETDAGFDIGIPPLWRPRDVNGNPRDRVAAELYAMTSDDRAARIDHLQRRLADRKRELGVSEEEWRQCVERLNEVGERAGRLSLGDDQEMLQYTSVCKECAPGSTEPASWPSMDEVRSVLKTMNRQRREILEVKSLLKSSFTG